MLILMSALLLTCRFLKSAVKITALFLFSLMLEINRKFVLNALCNQQQISVHPAI